MLRKIGKFLTYKALILIYKQVILPIMDYAGFLMIAYTKDRKCDMQIMQNDALRFCSKNRRVDRILLEEMHKTANLSSLEQRRCIQLLTLMYKLSQDVTNRKIGARNTRNQDKFVFKMDSKIGTTYEKSPFYKGCKLWDKLTKEVQFSNSVTLFKQVIKMQYKTFDNNLIV